MARVARLVVPGMPHHVTQRGNRRQQTFFNDGDYVELNPVRAKLVPSPAAWPWSSARAHLSGRDDCLVKVAPLLAMIAEWRAFLNSAVPEEELRDLRRHGRTGRPLGDEAFLGRLEERVGRALKPQKRGPKPKQKAN